MPLVFSWRGHSLPAGQSQHNGQALSPDKVTHPLIPAVGTLVSALARGYLMTETAYYWGGCDLTWLRITQLKPPKNSNAKVLHGANGQKVA